RSEGHRRRHGRGHGGRRRRLHRRLRRRPHPRAQSARRRRQGHRGRVRRIIRAQAGRQARLLSHPNQTKHPSEARQMRDPAEQHANPKSDIEISQAAKMRPIAEVAKEKLGIDAKNLEPYGHYKAKVSLNYVKTLKDKPNGKLVLVSAITPTPAGEGKTTTT